MEYFDNILCVTYKELLDIMPKGTLNSQLSREKLDVVSRGGGENNPALYAYSSLPEKYKKRWVERHGAVTFGNFCLSRVRNGVRCTGTVFRAVWGV